MSCTILVNNQIFSVFKDMILYNFSQQPDFFLCSRTYSCTISVNNQIFSVFKGMLLYNFSQQPDFFCVQGHTPVQFQSTTRFSLCSRTCCCTILVNNQIFSVFKDMLLYYFSQQPDFFCVQGHVL